MWGSSHTIWKLCGFTQTQIFTPGSLSVCPRTFVISASRLISLLSGNFAFLCEIVYYSHTADQLLNQSSLSTWNFHLGIHVNIYLTSVQRTNCKSKGIKNWRKKLKSLFHGQASSHTKQGIQELLVAYESIHVGIKLAEDEVHVFFRHWHGAFGQYPLKVCHAHLACARAVVLLETSSQVLPVLE